MQGFHHLSRICHFMLKRNLTNFMNVRLSIQKLKNQKNMKLFSRNKFQKVNVLEFLLSDHC